MKPATTNIDRRLPTHELNARRNRKRTLTRLPALLPITAPPPPASKHPSPPPLKP